MRKVLLSTGLLAAAVMAGCATYVPPAENKPADIREEAAAVTKHLGCKWMQLPDPMYPAKGKDFACVADDYASVILFVQPSDTMSSGGAPKVEKIKLVWKEWNSKVNMTESKRDASRFIAYIAQRYFPEKDAMTLVNMFFGTKDAYHNSANLDVKYTYRTQTALNLHRMEITNEEPNLDLYPFPAPYEIPAPAMAPANSTPSTTSNGE